MYLPAPAIAPSVEDVQAFCAAAQRANPLLEVAADNVEVRWIGLDAPSTLHIFDLIRAGDKRGTFTLPWIVERAGSLVPAVGRLLVLIDIGGKPVLLTRVVRVDRAIFGAVRAEHTVIDGSPVRDPATWVPLHTMYWNTHLQPFGLEVSPQMPFWIEEFELVYDGGN
jgi:uncharacterized protein YhfF